MFKNYIRLVSRYSECQKPLNNHLDNKLRLNKVNIQMINEDFHQILFGTKHEKDLNLSEIKTIFENFKIDMNKTSIKETVEFELPQILGNDIESHLKKAADLLNTPYTTSLKDIDKWMIPKMPTCWKFEEGWTKYDTNDNSSLRVKAPDEDLLIFDVETLPKHTQRAVMAVAVGRNYWYSWTSRCLLEKVNLDDSTLCKHDLIPIYPTDERSPPKCIIGHFVTFDRARIKDEYEIKGTGARFIDTMSLHIAIRGMTSLQKSLKTSYSKNRTDNKIWKQYFMHNRNYDGSQSSVEESDKWINDACLNSLVDIYGSYFPGCDLPLQKDKRGTFVKGTVDDVISDFQGLMKYCAIDVLMTAKIFKIMWPEYCIRFPHPASLTGMLEMGSLYLPINNNFESYIDKANSTYNRTVKEEKGILMELAQKALTHANNNEYQHDPWLWDLNWNVTKSSTVPKWFKELVVNPSVGDCNTMPDLISAQKRVAVKLLKLKWDGLPLHYDQKMKWGILIPGKFIPEYNDSKFMDTEKKVILPVIPVEKKSPTKIEIQYFPLQKYLEFWMPMFMTRLDEILKYVQQKNIKSRTYQDVIQHVIDCVNMLLVSPEDKMMINSRLFDIKAVIMEKCTEQRYCKDYQPNLYEFQMNDMNYFIKSRSSLQTINPEIPFVWFLPLPHENGEGNFVGSPLSKSFLNHIQSGRLTSHTHNNLLELMIEGKKSGVFWRNYQNRIGSQLIVRSSEKLSEFAILPQVIVAGTVTRRSVERLWLTATNAIPDRIGSELKAMVQTPENWVLVGADVDSQEQWIAAVLGDSVVGVHGGTPFGWLVLQGTKAEGTDLHSTTSKMIGISRDAAKVLNYSRMYGAGLKKSTDTLLKFNPELTYSEAAAKIKSLMLQTKGRKTEEGWVDGIESKVFSKLEHVAKELYPKTPVLDARLSKSLEKPLVDDKFMTSKCNWVVQSSGVDYLHCLLTFTKLLINQYQVNARLCMCIHDEIRYLCHETDKYRMALVLQVANLFTRSAFSMKLNLNDLPQSVAFFSEVEIDRCLRKNPADDCKTPSNAEGLLVNYQIEKGESLNIYQILEKTGGKLS